MPQSRRPIRKVRRLGWTCDQVRARRQLILHGTMSPMQRQTFESHVRTCDSCRHMVTRWRLTEPPDGAA